MNIQNYPVSGPMEKVKKLASSFKVELINRKVHLYSQLSLRFYREKEAKRKKLLVFLVFYTESKLND